MMARRHIGCCTVLLALAGALPQAWGQAKPARPAAKPAPVQTVPVSRFDDKAIEEAIKATVAEMPKLPDPAAPADFRSAANVDSAGQVRPSKTDQAFIDAEVGSCLKSDALKQNPPVIHVGGVPVVLGGLLALPHVFYAAATGLCR